jgi:hypothetical protein
LRTLFLGLFVAVMLCASAAPASAGEYIQHPYTGAYWYCDYYSDGYYWCYVPSYGWTMAKPGWQYGPLGG